MRQLLRYWHTVRYLRPVQVYGRAQHRFMHGVIDTSPPPARRALSGGWVRPAARRPSLIGSDVFSFLNETHAVTECGWDDPGLAKLWRYNLHYFDDLTATDSRTRTDWHAALLRRWVRDNRPGAGSGWEPYPTSLRIVNWIKWVLGGEALPSEALASLAVQTRWLASRLELHLLGNHLFANAKALTFAGVFFQGPEARRWLERGLRLIEREVREQILPDGGHFERSPMYHALALEDMLDLCNLFRAAGDALPPGGNVFRDEIHARVDGMCHWLATMCHPDGEIAFFNDAAAGIAPTPAELAHYAGRLGFADSFAPPRDIEWLRDTGYIRVAHREITAILDVAAIGPDYLPGHAHADTLSFELSLRGQRVFVNSGTSEYGTGPERLRQRGTAAHNTVLVNHEDSSEVWAGFRVARRARPFNLRVTEAWPVRVSCSHDGYRRLRGAVVHTRTWSFGDRSLVIDDRLSGRYLRAEARFHLHPAVHVANLDQREATVTLPDQSTLRIHVDGASLRSEVATWHPEFGRVERTMCLVASFERPEARTQIEWA